MTSMGDRESQQALRELLRDYVGYVLTSARGLYREPDHYGPMRMVDAMEKAMVLMQTLGLEDESLAETMAAIRENRWRAGTDPQGFCQALDEAILRLVNCTLEESEGQA